MSFNNTPNTGSRRIGCIRVFLVLALAVSSMTAVNAENPAPDGTALAEFEGGSVSRSEFRAVMLIRFQGRIPANVRVRRAFLRKYALLRLAASRGHAEGMRKSGNYIKRSALLSERVRIEAYRRYLRGLPPRGVYRMMRLQILLLKKEKRKGPPDGTAGGESQTLARAGRAIAARLNRPGLSDTEIENILADNTDSLHYKASGGLLSPQCMDCAWNPTRGLTSTLEKTPVRRFVYNFNRYGHMVVRRLAIETVQSRDLKKYFVQFYRAQARVVLRNINRIKDPKARQSTRRAFPADDAAVQNLATHHRDYFVNKEVRGRFRRRIEAFKNARGLRLYPGASGRVAKNKTYNRETPLYLMSGRVFTYGNLTDMLPAPHFTHTARLRRLQIIITDRLLSSGLTYQRMTQRKAYKSLLAYAETAVMGRVYLDARIPDVPDVPEKAIRGEYEKNKTSRYRGRKYNRVRRRIMINLQQKAYDKTRGKFEADLARKFKLRLFNEKI